MINHLNNKRNRLMEFNFDINSLETGDLLLFTSNKWYSKLIEFGTNSVYSHCGIIVKSPTYLNTSLTGVYLLEASYEPFEDVIDKKQVFGVELVDISKVFNEYYGKIGLGKIYHRKLITNINMNTVIQQFFQLVHDKPYNIDPLDWIQAWTGFEIFDKQITSRFWCSALASYIYTKAEILDELTPWTLVTPKQLSIEGIGLKFNKGTLGPQTIII